MSSNDILIVFDKFYLIPFEFFTLFKKIISYFDFNNRRVCLLLTKRKSLFTKMSLLIVVSRVIWWIEMQ
jgi:hypothetical protein